MRYVLKKISSSGRGGGPKISEWYVYDSKLHIGVSATSCIKSEAQRLCNWYNENAL